MSRRVGRRATRWGLFLCRLGIHDLGVRDLAVQRGRPLPPFHLVDTICRRQCGRVRFPQNFLEYEPGAAIRAAQKHLGLWPVEIPIITDGLDTDHVDAWPALTDVP